MDPKKYLKRKYLSDNPEESEEFNMDKKPSVSSKNNESGMSSKRKLEGNLSDDSDESSPKRKLKSNETTCSAALSDNLYDIKEAMTNKFAQESKRLENNQQGGDTSLFANKYLVKIENF
jgi:hypothetical protein